MASKIRKCRLCGKEYEVPSPWPGYCSSECRIRRKGLRKIKRPKIHSVIDDIAKKNDGWITEEQIDAKIQRWRDEANQ